MWLDYVAGAIFLNALHYIHPGQTYIMPLQILQW